jgi:hypothetical protein
LVWNNSLTNKTQNRFEKYFLTTIIITHFCATMLILNVFEVPDLPASQVALAFLITALWIFRFLGLAGGVIFLADFVDVVGFALHAADFFGRGETVFLGRATIVFDFAFMAGALERGLGLGFGRSFNLMTIVFVDEQVDFFGGAIVPLNGCR